MPKDLSENRTDLLRRDTRDFDKRKFDRFSHFMRY